MLQKNDELNIVVLSYKCSYVDDDEAFSKEFLSQKEKVLSHELCGLVSCNGY